MIIQILKEMWMWGRKATVSTDRASTDETENSRTNSSSDPCESKTLTAVPATEHGHRLKHHLVKKQCHWFVIKLVLQKVAVVVDISPLTGDCHSL